MIYKQTPYVNNVRYYEPKQRNCFVPLRPEGARQPRTESWVAIKINLIKNGVGPNGYKLY